MRIGIDAMGGDQAPAAEAGGALIARSVLGRGDKIVLVGDESVIRPHLEGHDGWQDWIEIHHAREVISMDEPPVEALRAKPDSSIAVVAQLHADGDIDACISAGSTGAFVAAGQMRLRRLKGVHRPGILIVTPTPRGPVAVCDVGANVSCRPRHLHQYGIMASVYVNLVCGVREPRVGLLSVGEEEAKGNTLVKQTRELLENDSQLPFVGNVEGRDLFRGVCDVMVCEGFVGNVVLKLMEGMAEGVLDGMLKELAISMPEHAAAIKKAAGTILGKYDFNEYGGAPLLGVDGICIICHGASNHRGIKNAIQVAAELSKHHVNERIVELLSR